MANYLYNGVELPDINEVWTDKETYPYAYIVFSSGYGSSLMIATSKLWFSGNAAGEYGFYESGASYASYLLFSTESELATFAELMGDTLEGVIAAGFGVGYWIEMLSNGSGVVGTATPGWASADVINAVTDEVVVAASDPVPVDDETTDTTPINANAHIVKGGKVYKVGKLYQARVGADPILQEKTVTENGEVTADEGYEGLSKVTVNVAAEGGLDINGVVKAYQVNAGASVNAGDFVEFITRWGNGEFHAADAYHINAVSLSDNRVLVVYVDGGNSNHVTAVMLTIDGTTVSTGDKYDCGVIAYYTTSYVQQSLTAVALSDSKVLIAYCEANTSNSNQGVYAKVLSIDGTVISVGDTKFTIASGSSNTTVKAVALSDSKVLVSYNYYSSYNHYGRLSVLTIDGDTITKYGALNVYQTSASPYPPGDLVALTNTKVLAVAPPYSSSTGVTATVYTISDTSITAGTRVTIDEEVSFYCSYSRATAVALSDSKVFVAYGNGSCARAVVLTISGTVVTLGEITSIGTTANYIAGAALTDGKVLVSYYGTAQVLTVDGTTISAVEELIFNPDSTGATTGTYKDLLALSSGSALVVFNSNGLGSYKCLEIDGTTVTVQDTEDNGVVVQPATNRLHNVGVAKTSGAEGETVEVYCVT